MPFSPGQAHRHPDYERWYPEWEQLCDVYEGERRVKSCGTKYLPATASQYEDGYGTEGPDCKGARAYRSYNQRAEMRNFLKRKISKDLGIMWSKEPSIEVPEAMAPMLDRLTKQGESAHELLMRINFNQLLTSRMGLMVDMPDAQIRGRGMPYLALYEAKDIINWDADQQDDFGRDALNLVVLDESGYRRNNSFQWEHKEQYRVLWYGELAPNEQDEDSVVAPGRGEEGSNLGYRVSVVESTSPEETFMPEDFTEPDINGVRPDYIPFVFINATDLNTDVQEPTLLEISNKDLALYRKSADLETAIHNQGSETLIMTGFGEPSAIERRRGIRVGAGASLRDPNPQARAYYIGVSSQGLPEMRANLELGLKEVEELSGSLTDMRSNQQQSGDAMGKRMAQSSVSLMTLAIIGAAGLQRALRMAAQWMGLNPDEVSVIPNLEFSQVKLTVDDISKLVQINAIGGPVTRETIHEQMRLAGITRKEFEDEESELEQEPPIMTGTGVEDDQDQDQE